MSYKGLIWMRAVLPSTLAIAAVLALPNANAQSNGDQTVQSAAKTDVYRDLSANESRMAATRQDKAQIEAAIAKSNAVLSRASPAVHAWVREEGQRQVRGEPSGPAIAAAARARFGNNLSTMDIDQLIMLVMAETAREADQELRDQLTQMQAINQQKRAQREASQKMHDNQSAMRATVRAELRPAQPRVPRADLAAYIAHVSDGKDSLEDMSEEQQLKMQMVMDRMQKALDAMSILAKKESDAANSIIGNLK
jgi:hypothetical protein